MRETHALLKQLQTVVLDEQVDRFVGRSARCLACGAPLGIKDTKRLVYRTTFGKASLRSSRFYSHCSGCGFCWSDKATVSPLAHALPQRVHPQWSWLQCRYASVMSYRLAQVFLRDAFLGGSQLPSSSVKVNVREIGNRPLNGPPVALQIDAGYIKAPRQLGGSRSSRRRSFARRRHIRTLMPTQADMIPGKGCVNKHSCNRSGSVRKYP